MKIWNQKLRYWTRSNRELKATLDNQQEMLDKYLQEYKKSKKQAQESTKEIKMLRKLQKDQERLDGFKTNHKGYNKKLFDLIFQLKQVFVCPLSLDCLSNPVILPSGVTINEEFFDKLINKKDPYNNKLDVNYKIHNRFAAEVKEIVEACEKQLINEQLNDKEPSIDTQECSNCTQTDFSIEAEEEKIADIEQLNSLTWANKIDEQSNQYVDKILKEIVNLIQNQIINFVKENYAKLDNSKANSSRNNSIVQKEYESKMNRFNAALEKIGLIRIDRQNQNDKGSNMNASSSLTYNPRSNL